MLKDRIDPRTGARVNVTKRKRKPDQAAARKVALAHAESMTDATEGTAPPVPPPGAPISPEPAAPPPAANGEDEVALARMTESEDPPLAEAERASLSSVELALLPTTPPAQVIPPAAPPVAAPVAIPAADALSPLEQRIRRIEDALAHLQLQRSTETRIAAPAAASPPPPAATAAILDMGKRLLGAAADAVTPATPPAASSTLRGRSIWFLWDTWAEARAIARMFVDPRYYLSWSARVLPMILLGAILTSYYWVPGTTIPLLGGWINKAVDLVLAFVLFKWLGHEARRYRQTSPDLPPNLRL
jgi:hypothetical protein